MGWPANCCAAELASYESKGRTCEGAGVEEVAQLGGEGLELLHKGLGVLACR